MKYDEIIVQLGEFGPYQKRLYFLLCLPSIFLGLQTMLTIFTLGVPEHRCHDDGIQNQTFYWNQDKDIIYNSDSDGNSTNNDMYYQYASCSVNLLRNNSQGNKTEIVWKQSCDRWVYNNSTYGSTVVTELSWVCDLSLRKSHCQMLLMFGSLLGCIVLVSPSDLIGRKKMFMFGVVTFSISTITIAFVKSFPLFGFLYFLMGMGSAAIWTNGFVIGVELVGPSKRLWAGLIVEFFWSSGYMIAVGVAYFIRDWNILQLVVSAPAVLLLSYFWFIPESPRWLLSKRKYEEASRIFQKAAKVNKVPCPDISPLDEDTRTEKPWSLFTNPVLVCRLLIMSLNWFVCSLGFFGLGLNIGSLAGNVYTNGFISAVIEEISYLACLLVLHRVGRRSLHCLSMIVGGLCCTATILPIIYGKSSLGWLTVTLALTGRGFVSASFAIVWLYTSELFPTVVRNSAMATANICARVGGLISPYIANLSLIIPGDLGRAAPLIIFGVSMVLSGLLALLLPETKNKDLPESVTDVQSVKANDPRYDVSDARHTLEETKELVHSNITDMRNAGSQLETDI